MPCIFVTVLTKNTFISECAINSTTAMTGSTFTPCLFSLQCAMSIKEKLEPPLNGERIGVFFSQQVMWGESDVYTGRKLKP